MLLLTVALLTVGCSESSAPRSADVGTMAPTAQVLEAGTRDAPVSPDAGRGVRGSVDVSERLASLRRAGGVIALGGAVVGPDGLIAVGADGLRSRTESLAVTPQDRWHLGSNTKAMTGYLAAILVRKGILSWSTTVVEVFPEAATSIEDALRTLTLVELLTHRAGLAADPPEDLWAQLWKNEGTLVEQRARFVRDLLARSPQARPRTEYIYSNSGFIVAGALLERASGKSWEDLMEAEVFAPLGMTDCGFGPAATVGSLDAPLGHKSTMPPDPVPAGPEADNPPALGPAGTVHCSLESWALYVAAHLRSGRGADDQLPPETFARLHADPGFGAPPDFGYGYGWSVVDRPWAGGLTLTHRGSNTMNLSVAWLAPNRGRAYLAVANEALDRTAPVLDQVVGALLADFPPP